jgi:hypothetical protein
VQGPARSHNSQGSVWQAQFARFCPAFRLSVKIMNEPLASELMLPIKPVRDNELAINRHRHLMMSFKLQLKTSKDFHILLAKLDSLKMNQPVRSTLNGRRVAALCVDPF